MNHYVYLLREREFIKTEENVFKIGKTKQNGLSRFKNYPSGSELIVHVKCIDCDSSERKLIDLFKEKYKQRKDIGTEYFEGNCIDMMNSILMHVLEINEHLPKDDDNIKLPNIDPSIIYLIKSMKNDIRPSWLNILDGIYKFHISAMYNTKNGESNFLRYCEDNRIENGITLHGMESSIKRYIGDPSRIQILGKRLMGYKITKEDLQEKLSKLYGDKVSAELMKT